MVYAPSSIGPYRLLRKLGEGGMGQVFEAVHETLDRQVAVKLLRSRYADNEDALRRFMNEARASNRVKHPGLVEVSDCGQLPDGTAYIIMEYLAGETLGQRLKGTPDRLPLPQILHICWQLASALTAAHQKGIVHRDLKPDNIMLVPDLVSPSGERAKILDFGLARLARDGNSIATLSSSDHIMGTPLYMSPEQCRGSGLVDERTDVYALGVILYQLLAGRPPFVAAGIGEVLSLHMHSEPTPLADLVPSVPVALATLVATLLRKNRDERPQMAQVVVSLEALEAQQGSAGTGKAPSVKSSSSGRSAAPAPKSSPASNPLAATSHEANTAPTPPSAATEAYAETAPSISQSGRASSAGRSESAPASVDSANPPPLPSLSPIAAVRARTLTFAFLAGTLLTALSLTLLFLHHGDKPARRQSGVSAAPSEAPSSATPLAKPLPEKTAAAIVPAAPLPVAPASHAAATVPHRDNPAPLSPSKPSVRSSKTTINHESTLRNEQRKSAFIIID